MKKLNISVMLLLASFGFASLAQASGGGNENFEPIDIDPLNRQESLQNGAKLFVNYCLGCHSAKYVRYERIAQDLELSVEDVSQHLMFTGDKIGDQMRIAMPADEAKAWFGATPPDLSLEARLRGTDWVYNYLIGFYPDESRPFGYNNKVFPSVGMPNVMEAMQKSMSEEEFKSNMYDLTNFMDYIAEPTKKRRIELGRMVILFLLFIMLPVVVWLNHEYWKDIH